MIQRRLGAAGGDPDRFIFFDHRIDLVEGVQIIHNAAGEGQTLFQGVGIADGFDHDRTEQRLIVDGDDDFMLGIFFLGDHRAAGDAGVVHRHHFRAADPELV